MTDQPDALLAANLNCYELWKLVGYSSMANPAGATLTGKALLHAFQTIGASGDPEHTATMLLQSPFGRQFRIVCRYPCF